jgi:hypothetical protein
VTVQSDVGRFRQSLTLILDVILAVLLSIGIISLLRQYRANLAPKTLDFVEQFRKILRIALAYLLIHNPLDREFNAVTIRNLAPLLRVELGRRPSA